MADDCKPKSWSRWAGVMLTAMIAVSAYAVQWGVVTTKLDQIDRQLGNLAVELRSMRTDLTAAERRLSFVEGQLTGTLKAKP